MKDKNNGCLLEAFRKLRDNEKLSDQEKEAIATLTDMFVTCSLNPDTIHEDKQIGKRIIDLSMSIHFSYANAFMCRRVKPIHSSICYLVP